ncbi:hypothetical protein D3C83_301370 [compost metagenome]
MELVQLVIVALEGRDQRAVVLREHDARRQRLAQIALGPLHLDRIAGDLHRDTLRERDWLLTDT